MKKLEDFEVWIEPLGLGGVSAQTSYAVRVVASPVGIATGELKLDLTSADFAIMLARVCGKESNLDLRKQFGNTLFAALFNDKVESLWRQSLARVESSQESNGIRLRLMVVVPELAALPWELLYHPDDGFLATAANQVVSRYLPVPAPPYLRIEGKLRILLVVQSPNGFPVDAQEVKNLESAIQGLGKAVEYVKLDNKPVDDIRDELQKDYHVLHFLGHGSAGKLALTEADGSPKLINDEEFAQLVLGRRLRLIILNACASSMAEDGTLFAGIGPALVQKRMPAVIAMQYPAVLLETAGRFSRAFYRSLANGIPVDMAVNEGRGELSTGDLLHNRDWSTPVLYMGTRDGRILDIPHEADTAGDDLGRPLQLAVEQFEEARLALSRLTDKLQEIEQRVNRLEEWRVLEFQLRAFSVPFDGFNGLVKRIGGTKEEQRNALIETLEYFWDACQDPFDTLKSEVEHFNHISVSLSIRGSGQETGVKQWLAELTELQGQVHTGMSSLKIEDLAQYGRLLWNKLTAQLKDARTRMKTELEELRKLTIQINSGLGA